MLRRAQHDIFVSFLRKLRHPELVEGFNYLPNLVNEHKKLRKHTCAIIN